LPLRLLSIVSSADSGVGLAGVFAEARADLVRTLVPPSGSRVEGRDSSPAKTPASPTPESADETIESILKGK
ncbi:MAG: hypothetical protein HGB32_14745, partial [Geobacteraceae bacterium]|nr:hypothetical protein [Geobacteraceae bacterium]